MWKDTIKSGIFLMLFFSIISLAYAVTPEGLRKTIEEKSKELELVNRQIEQTQGNIEELEAKSRTLSNQIRSANYRINQLNLGIKSSQIRIEKLTLEIEDLDNGIKKKEEDIEFKKKAIAELLRQLQEKDNTNLLMILLKNQSLAESLSESESILGLNDGLSQEILALEFSKNELLNELNQTAVKKSQVQKENTTLKNQRVIVEEQKQERSTLLSTAKNQEKTYQEQLAELEKQQAEIGNVIDDIEKQLREQFDQSLLPVKRPGVLGIPISGSPRMTQEYGATSYAARAYSTKFHNGVDFGAPFATPVLAARDGEVFAVGNNGRFQYGKYVLIKHDNGLTSLYAHLSRQGVSKGDQVKKGQVIGYVGNTGYSFGHHLHFSVYWSSSVLLKNFATCRCGLVPVGVTVNPLDYLDKI